MLRGVVGGDRPSCRNVARSALLGQPTERRRRREGVTHKRREGCAAQLIREARKLLLLLHRPPTVRGEVTCLERKSQQ